MPFLLKHIDAIAREKMRGVLFVTFAPTTSDEANGDDDLHVFPPSLDWEHLDARKMVIAWLENNCIPWQPCGEFSNPELMICYQGQIYIDLPYDRSLTGYKKLERFLENPDGTMRYAGVGFYHLPLDVAMRNRDHDAPGYWESWAEKF